MMTTHQNHLTLAYVSKITFKVDYDVMALKFSMAMVLVKGFATDKTISVATLVAIHITSKALSWL
jgi:hypothetical protein